MSVEDEEAITRLLVNWRRGDEESLPRLMTALQSHLRKLANIQFSRERANHSLQPPALVGELYLRLRSGVNIDWKDRAHFFAVSSNIMRRILIDYARKRERSLEKDQKITLSQANELLPETGNHLGLLDLDRALEELKDLNEAQHRVVILRFYGGLTMEEIGEVMGMTERSVQRKWAAARVWLLARLKGVL